MSIEYKAEGKGEMFTSDGGPAGGGGSYNTRHREEPAVSGRFGSGSHLICTSGHKLVVFNNWR
jgi:hypothetical protein